ncbi:MAG: transcription antitermination factor NusB [Kiritimatiellales bacterium]|nr:transcription antitermination factor NusB [Kiritimatiellales bacterium]
MARRRHLSRIAAMQALFEAERRPIESVDSLERNIKELGEVDEGFALVLLEGVENNKDAIVQELEKHAPGWTYDRMDPIARCILLIGAFELLYADDAPPAVVMDESIDIAKEYGTDESGKFVNGVLNALAKDLSK